MQQGGGSLEAPGGSINKGLLMQQNFVAAAAWTTEEFVRARQDKGERGGGTWEIIFVCGFQGVAKIFSCAETTDSFDP